MYPSRATDTARSGDEAEGFGAPQLTQNGQGEQQSGSAEIAHVSISGWEKQGTSRPTARDGDRSIFWQLTPEHLKPHFSQGVSVVHG